MILNCEYRFFRQTKWGWGMRIPFRQGGNYFQRHGMRKTGRIQGESVGYRVDGA